MLGTLVRLGVAAIVLAIAAGAIVGVIVKIIQNLADPNKVSDMGWNIALGDLDADGGLTDALPSVDDFDFEGLAEEIWSELLPTDPVCVIDAQEDGTCRSGLYLDTHGCCQFEEDTRLEQTVDRAVDFTTQLITETIITETVEFVVGKLFLGPLKRAMQRFVQRNAGKQVGKIAARKLSAKMIGSIGKRIATKMAVNVASRSLRIAKSIKPNPLMIIEIVVLVVDLIDAEGYGTVDQSITGDSMTPAQLFMIFYKSLAVCMEAECVKLTQQQPDNPILYPQMMTPGDFYPSFKLDAKGNPILDEHGFAIPDPTGPWYKAISDLWWNYEMEALESLPEEAESDAEFSAWLEACVDAETEADIPPLPNNVLVYVIAKIEALQRADPVKRDRYLMENLKKHMPEKDHWRFQLYEHMSAVGRYGIGFSEQMCNEWNNARWEEWAHLNNDWANERADAPPNQDMMAVFTKHYYGLDLLDTSDKPKIIMYTLSEPAPLSMFFGPLVAKCQRIPHAQEFGVILDIAPNLVCKYTQDYCERYGADHTRRWEDGKYLHDCKIDDVQQWLELFFGTSSVRGFKRRVNNIRDAFDRGEIGEGLYNIWLLSSDPLHIGMFGNFSEAGNRFRDGDILGGLYWSGNIFNQEEFAHKTRMQILQKTGELSHITRQRFEDFGNTTVDAFTVLGNGGFTVDSFRDSSMRFADLGQRTGFDISNMQNIVTFDYRIQAREFTRSIGNWASNILPSVPKLPFVGGGGTGNHVIDAIITGLTGGGGLF